MSAARVSKLVAPSAGRRNAVNNNNNGDVRASPKRTAVGRNNVVGGGQSTSSRSSSVASSAGNRLPRSGAGEDYVSVQFVNGTQCSQSDTSSSDVDGHVTSLERQQQTILSNHLQVNTVYLYCIVMLFPTVSVLASIGLVDLHVGRCAGVQPMCRPMCPCGRCINYRYLVASFSDWEGTERDSREKAPAGCRGSRTERRLRSGVPPETCKKC